MERSSNRLPCTSWVESQGEDGGSGGTTLIEVDIPSNSNPNSFYTLVPGEGVLFSTNVYATLTGIASVTVYYG